MLIESENIHRPVNLLWTGGWDSTFWLTYAICIKGYSVKPYYIIDPKRKSSLIELQTMNKIKEMLFKMNSSFKELLLPLQIYSLNDIKENKKITDYSNILRKETYFGGQYEWLARFADEHCLENLHLCVQKENHPTGFNAILKVHTESFIYDNHMYHKCSKKYLNTKMDLIKNFLLPIYHLTKQDMKKISQEHDFYSILKMTWFCHNPLWDIIPCGTCAPCIHLMQVGMSDRLYLLSKVNYYFYTICYKPIKSFLKPLY
ncbi:hypothetical protein BVX93_02260, partial [bacterium B13(2017)]